MPNPTTNFRDSSGLDLGNKLITKEYLMSVYPQIAANMITPELYTWGSNYQFGVLGDNTTITKSTPVTTFAGGANWKQVSNGSYNIVAIKTDGTLWIWGDNTHGALGDNTTITRSIPVTTFAGGTNWKQVSCGGQFTAAIKTDGTLWTWGYNYNGELGDNTGYPTADGACTPVTTFAGGTNWKQVSCGNGHTAAIKTDGTLWTWGYNYYGTLGDNTTITRSIPVTTFAGGTNWKQVSTGGSYTAAIKTDGTLWTWGNNSSGQLGINNATSAICTPITTFAGGTNWKQVGCGYHHTSAIKTDGTLWVWGYNYYGTLGINNTTSKLTPVTTFAGRANWKQVSCGGEHTAAIKTDGTLWTWGSNNFGEMGNVISIRRDTPITTFAGGTNWKQVSAGNRRTAAIKTSDNLQGI